MGFRVLKEMTEAEIARAATRSALRAQWDALPAWINGPYRTVFDAVNNLLDENKDTAAAELIDSCEPTTKISSDAATYPELGGATRLQYFTAVQAQFKAAIEAL